MKYVALLRGINVGGHNKIKMKDLQKLLIDRGLTDVQTYIQSGNIVCTSDTLDEAEVADLIHDAIEEKYGYNIPVVVRDAADFLSILTRNRYLELEDDPKKTHVVFLLEQPADIPTANLDYTLSPPDQFYLDGREIFLHTPNGLARTKLTNAYFDRTLKTISTARNWRTLQKIAEMLN
ncbi:DUF1697 domain-containing protein [bacterium]|nr:DUF1697 domain-containing protein [bacterium]